MKLKLTAYCFFIQRWNGNPLFCKSYKVEYYEYAYANFFLMFLAMKSLYYSPKSYSANDGVSMLDKFQWSLWGIWGISQGAY